MSKKIIGLIAIIAVVFGVIAYQNGDTVNLRKQLDFDKKYLLEENHERAIAELSLAIQIDPHCSEAYL